MRRLLTISGALALFAAPALAQQDYGAEPHDRPALDDRATGANETRIDVDGDGDLETLKNGYTDAHDWVDAPVYADGEQVGEVERVHYDGEEVDAIVIETGGVADVGGREVEIPLDDAKLTAEEDGEAAFTLAMTSAELDSLPDFEEEKASDYPLSDNPAVEDSPGGYRDDRAQ
jgi:hypothetical protein